MLIARMRERVGEIMMPIRTSFTLSQTINPGQVARPKPSIAPTAE